MERKNIISKIKKINPVIILVIIMVIAVIRLVDLYSYRNGHHIDETWSYGLANSYYFPHVFGGFEEEQHRNIGEWVDGRVFLDYLSVTEDHRFSFDSVLYNSNYDLSPPLYTYFLHFICSLFPGEFSWNFAFAISLICFVPSLLLIYLITYEFTDSKIAGLLSVLYYTFSGCGTANFLYLRVYHMLTFFTLLLFWLFIKIIKNEKKNKIYFCIIPFVTFLGAYTHYYFLVLAFSFTVFGALILLIKKRFKEFFALCALMLLPVVLFILSYEPALRKLIPSSSGVYNEVTGYYKYPYEWDFRIANVHFFKGTLGYCVDFSFFDVFLIFGVMVFLIMGIALIIFLFRNEEWMKKTVSFFKGLFKNIKKVFLNYCHQFNVSLLIGLFTVIFYLFFVPVSATLTNMGFVERYFFAAMSLFVTIYISLIYGFLKAVYSYGLNKKVFIFMICAMTVCVGFFCNYSNNYVYSFGFSYMEESELKDALAGKKCYFALDKVRDMVWLSSAVYTAGDMYFDLMSDIVSDDYETPEIDEDTYLLIVDSGLLSDEQKKQLSNINELELEGYINTDTLATIDDVLSSVTEGTGYDFEYVRQYNTFLGNIRLYKPVSST